jgi:exodeoxyribonuclease VII large subunit
MQGDRVEESVLSALDKINSRSDSFDVVVIIRGGGATSDLSGFDTYLLAAACAQFPLPVITGIGHERDDTVLDSVAHTRVKTPTAAAEFLIDCMNEAADELESLAARLCDGVRILLVQEQQKLVSYRNRIPSAAYGCISDAQLTLLTVRKDIVQAVTASLFRQHHRLELLQQRLADASPEKQLARGYSITLKNGKAIKNASLLNEGDEIITRLYKGEVVSVVTNKLSKNK